MQTFIFNSGTAAATALELVAAFANSVFPITLQFQNHMPRDVTLPELGNLYLRNASADDGDVGTAVVGDIEVLTRAMSSLAQVVELGRYVGAITVSDVANAASAEPAKSRTLTAPGVTPGVTLKGNFNVSVSGVFTGSIRLERSFDAGVTWLPLTDQYGAQIAFTTPVSLVAHEPEANVMYRGNATALSSGSATIRLSQ